MDPIFLWFSKKETNFMSLPLENHVSTYSCIVFGENWNDRSNYTMNIACKKLIQFRKKKCLQAIFSNSVCCGERIWDPQGDPISHQHCSWSLSHLRQPRNRTQETQNKSSHMDHTNAFSSHSQPNKFPPFYAKLLIWDLPTLVVLTPCLNHTVNVC